MTNMINKVMLP